MSQELETKNSPSVLSQALADAVAATPKDIPLATTSSKDEPVQRPTLDSSGRAYATGKRKDACARVWIKRGSGKWSVNGQTPENYFKRATLCMIAAQPLVATERQGQFDVISSIKGSGLSGQAGALRHGISRALVNFDPELRSLLRKQGFLTRDSRIVERKKYGHHKARRSHQFSKR